MSPGDEAHSQLGPALALAQWIITVVLVPVVGWAFGWVRKLRSDLDELRSRVSQQGNDSDEQDMVLTELKRDIHSLSDSTLRLTQTTEAHGAQLAGQDRKLDELVRNVAAVREQMVEHNTNMKHGQRKFDELSGEIRELRTELKQL